MSHAYEKEADRKQVPPNAIGKHNLVRIEVVQQLNTDHRHQAKVGGGLGEVCLPENAAGDASNQLLIVPKDGPI